jgi:hypothetical protein
MLVGYTIDYVQVFSDFLKTYKHDFKFGSKIFSGSYIT